MTDRPTVVSSDWLDAHLDSVTVVDVREAREYGDVGHVDGAVNVPAETFRDPGSVAPGKLPTPDAFADVLGEVGVERGNSIVAYDGERGVLAARFLLTAVAYGHAGRLYLLDGGLKAWRREHVLETESPTVEPTTYEIGVEDPLDETSADTDDGPVVDRDDVEEAIDGDTVLVDTRTPAEFEQAHIPGAIQLGWEDLLTEDNEGIERLRERTEVEALLAEKGIRPDERIVLYCNTARRLSHTFVVLSHLGYENVQFYEGSLTDWIRANSSDWDPIRLYERVREVAPQGFEALPRELGEDVFGRLHLIGLYTQRQDGYFMLRTKVPGGRLTAEQARTFGEIVDEFARAPPDHGGEAQNPEFGDGFLDVTTRQGLQAHWIRIEDMPEIWDRYEEVGLTTIQASGNTLRNVVTCPAAGLADETLDVRSLGDDVADAFEGNLRYANLPRKFKVSLAGCHENCGRAEIQDLGFTPAVKDGRDGFHVRVGGGLSDGPRVASDLGVFVEPDQVEAVTLAAADVFIEQGSYLDTAVNRLRYLVEELGVERFREELESHLEFDLETGGENLTTGYRGDHVGVHPQEDGRYYVGLNVPTGRTLGSEFVELASLAETYGDGEVRVTANQNVLLPGVGEESLDALLEEPLLSRYSPDPGPFSRGIVTCTGKEFCKYGVIETKNRGLQWARGLDQWLETDEEVDGEAIPDAIRVHLSGCSASCAQPQIGDVGLRGERYRTDEESGPAVDVGLGGDLENHEFIDWLIGSVPVDEIPATLERTVRAFATERRPNESFAEWTRRTPEEDLRGILVGERPPATADNVVETEVSQ